MTFNDRNWSHKTSRLVESPNLSHTVQEAVDKLEKAILNEGVKPEHLTRNLMVVLVGAAIFVRIQAGESLAEAKASVIEWVHTQEAEREGDET